MSAGTYSDPLFVITTLSGTCLPASTAALVLQIWIAPFQCRIGGIQAYAFGAGGGVGSTVLDVQVNNTSIWFTAANRPKLATASTGAFALAKPDTRIIRPGDVVVLEVLTVPASTGHSDIGLTVTLERAHQ